MKLRLPCAAVVFSLAGLSAPAQDKDANPFRNAKVGDFVAYKMTTKVMDKAIEGTMRQSVSEKNDKELTLKMVVSVMGVEIAKAHNRACIGAPQSAPHARSLPPCICRARSPRARSSPDGGALPCRS